MPARLPVGTALCCQKPACAGAEVAPSPVSQVGLDAAGKTTILYKLKLGEIVTTIPTIGEGRCWGRLARPDRMHAARAA